MRIFNSTTVHWETVTVKIWRILIDKDFNETKFNKLFDITLIKAL